MKVLVFGLGSCVVFRLHTFDLCHHELTISHSIGGFYAFILSRAKNLELSVVARSNYDIVKAEVCAGIACRERALQALITKIWIGIKD